MKNLIEETNDEPSSCGTCETCRGSIIYKIFAIVGFLLVGGTAAFAVLNWMKWESNKKDYNSLEKKVIGEKINLVYYQDVYKNLTKDYEEANKQLKKLKDQNHQMNEKIKDIKNKTVNIEKRLKEIRVTLEKVTKERDDEKAKYNSVKQIFDKLQKELRNLTSVMKELNDTLIKERHAVNTWKIISGISFGLVCIETIADIGFRYLVINEEHHLIRNKQRALDYHAAASGFETYAYLTREINKTVARTVCFHNGAKKDLSRCANQKPVLISINTYGGFTFGIFLSIGWMNNEGTYNDEGSFIISANHNETAVITKEASSKALTITKDTLMEFGNNGIVISLDGKNGTAKANGYHIPAKYSAENFLSGNATFDIADIKIEHILLKET